MLPSIYSLTHFCVVALSRAREGLYIFGNAENLSAKSKMWHSIIEELEAQDSLGNALPVTCHRHHEKVEYVSRPGQLARIAPDGRCHQSFSRMVLYGLRCSQVAV